MNNWPAIIQNVLYPPTCLLCGDPGTSPLDLCAACTAALPYIEHACPRCGAALPRTTAPGNACGRCQNAAPHYDMARILLHYHEPVRYLILALKFQRRYPCARLLGGLMAERWSELPERPEQIIPVPLHPRRFRQRGFNQALEIARPLARRLEIPVNPNACRRVRDTTPQTRLPAEARRKNLRNAFVVERVPRAKSIALLDDVVTTGATVDELARVLRAAGIEQITVWACARA